MDILQNPVLTWFYPEASKKVDINLCLVYEHVYVYFVLITVNGSPATITIETCDDSSDWTTSIGGKAHGGFGLGLQRSLCVVLFHIGFLSLKGLGGKVDYMLVTAWH